MLGLVSGMYDNWKEKIGESNKRETEHSSISTYDSNSPFFSIVSNKALREISSLGKTSDWRYYLANTWSSSFFTMGEGALCLGDCSTSVTATDISLWGSSSACDYCLSTPREPASI